MTLLRPLSKLPAPGQTTLSGPSHFRHRGFYVKAEFGKIHTTMFPGAKELTASVKCAPTSRSCGRLAAPLPSTEKAKSGHLRRENGVDSNQDFDNKHVLSVVRYRPGILVSVRLLLSNKASLSMFFSNLYTQWLAGRCMLRDVV